MKVVEAFNDKQALEKFISSKPDLIFMDIHMPEMDDLETTSRIRGIETESHVPVIALTADAMSGDKERCIQAGMDDYLAKPYIKKDIETLLKKYGKS